MTPDELRSLPKYQIIRALLDGTIPFHDVMRAFAIHTSIQELPPEALALVYRCRYGHYHIVVSSSLASEVQQQVLFHELKHVIEDMPSVGYVVGLDKQYEIPEQLADVLLREVSTGLVK